jgi:hypothetical protein
LYISSVVLNAIFEFGLDILLGAAGLSGVAAIVCLPLAGSNAIVRRDYKLLRRAGYLFGICVLFLILAGMVEALMLVIASR